MVDNDRDDSQKLTRLRSLCAILGLEAAAVGTLRYQLIHRTASAVFEARRYRAGDAAMLVQSFCPKGSWHKDFAAFASAAGFGDVQIGSISMPKDCGGVALRIGWVRQPDLRAYGISHSSGE